MIRHLLWCKIVISNDIPFACLGNSIFIAVVVVHSIDIEAISPNPRAVWGLPGSSYCVLIKAAFSLWVLSSKLAANPIGIAGRGYLAVVETLVVWLPVYLCPLHCPVTTIAPGCLAAAA